VKLYLHQLRGEQLLFWRTREAAVFVFVFPILLFVLVASVYTGHITQDGVQHVAASWLLTGMLGYGIANTAFAGLAITLVIRREIGVLKRLRATPLPSHTYFAALLVSTIVTFALQAIVLLLVGHFAYHAHMPQRALPFAVAMLVGALAFAGIGLGAAALIRSGEGSSAIVNVILVPMAFLSGSFGPTRHYPQLLRWLAAVLPLKHFLRIVNAVSLEHGGLWRPVDLGVLLLWGFAGLAIAARRFKWEPQAA
jgi:ABC-2 type transport system permease protein